MKVGHPCLATVNLSKPYMSSTRYLAKKKTIRLFRYFIISITTITLRGVPRYLDFFSGTILLLFEPHEEYFRYNRLLDEYPLARRTGALRRTICFQHKTRERRSWYVCVYTRRYTFIRIFGERETERFFPIFLHGGPDVPKSTAAGTAT